MSMSNNLPGTVTTKWQGKNCLCVFHNDHQLFGIGYHFKIFKNQVATEKISLFYALERCSKEHNP